MKIAIAQTNPVIGAFQANLDKLLSLTDKAKSHGCDLIIFPEMALSGYPPQDLLERPAFIADQQRYFRSLVNSVSDIAVLCGVITRHRADTGKPLHNSAALIENGQYNLTHKRLLPTYDVFDEARYFEPGQKSRVLSCKGINLGITICEDILNVASLPGAILEPQSDNVKNPKKLYSADPIADLLDDENPAQLLINIAASPFYLGKPALKLDYFSQLSKKTALPIIYVNQCGGQDSLLFDGMSLVFDTKGQLLAKGAIFSEDFLVINTDSFTDQPEQPISTKPSTKTSASDAEIVFNALVMGTKDYMTKCGFNKAVLGLSGGIDSALTAAIACRALGKENVLGVALPSPYTSKESIEDARQLADNLGIEFTIIPIKEIFSAQLSTLAPFFKDLPEDITEQNIQARIRGNILMALANKFGYLLLSTGNKSETAVGYCTLYGDMSGGLSVISDVPKTLVYKICHHLNHSQEIIPARTISKPPSAELAPDQKDQDDLPPYDILDPILEAYLEENRTISQIIEQGFDRDVVLDVVRRITINEHKRKQAPMGLKVTSKAFGYGRRYPTSQHYREGGEGEQTP